MARGMQTRKRSRPFTGRARRFKKRRTTRGRKTASVTTKSGSFRTIGNFRSRKTSLKAYRRRLWNNTLDKVHYRSVNSTTFSVASPANASGATSSVAGCMLLGGLPFWLASGGAQMPFPTASSIPVFEDKIVIRGGIINMVCTNDAADSYPMKVKAYLVKTGADFDATTFPATVSSMFDPSAWPDFNTLIGKVILSKEILLENNNSAELSYRLPVHMIEQGPLIALKKTYVWFFLTTCLNGVATNVTFTIGFNMSFSADADGTV